MNANRGRNTHNSHKNNERFHNFEYIPSQKYKLFLQTIEPILSYGSEVWGTEDGDQTENITQTIPIGNTGSANRHQNEVVYQELGSIPLKPRQAP